MQRIFENPSRRDMAQRRRRNRQLGGAPGLLSVPNDIAKARAFRKRWR